MVLKKTNPFGTPDLSAGYAIHRPALHPHIVRLAAKRMSRSMPVKRALDVGCGAGVSTKALEGLAGQRIGIEPAHGMLKRAAETAPGAEFAAAPAESIPLPDGSVDLITAAGSLNYVDLDLFFREAGRVLAPDGLLLVYDFSTGRSFRSDPGLDDWFSRFILRYPWPANEARELSPEILAQLDSGFRVQAERFEIALTLTPSSYLDYMMTETNVAFAMREGAQQQEIRAWCADTLAPVWKNEDHEVLFRGYFAWMTPS